MFPHPTVVHVRRECREQGLPSAISYCLIIAVGAGLLFSTPELLQGKRSSLWAAAVGSNYEAGCQRDKNSLRQLL